MAPSSPRPVQPLSATLCDRTILEKASKKGWCPDFQVFSRTNKKRSKQVRVDKATSCETKKNLRGLYGLPAHIFLRFAYALIFAICWELSRKVVEASNCILDK